MKSIFIFLIIFIFHLPDFLFAQKEDTGMMELLKYWAPQVYQGTRRDLDYVEAYDFIVKADFDGDWYAGNNSTNSTYPNDGNYPLMIGSAYVSVVESKSHYFLQYGYYHTYDDAVLPADQHENDYEFVVLAIEKNGWKYGKIVAMVTQSHGDFIPYYLGYGPFHNSKPLILITPNGDVFNRCLDFNARGHSIYFYESTMSCIEDDGIIYNVADVGESPTATSGFFKNSYNYALVSFNELWNRRDIFDQNPFVSYGVFFGDQANVPFDRDWLKDPAKAFLDYSEFDFMTSDPNYSREYLYNPYSDFLFNRQKTNHSQSGLDFHIVGNMPKTGDAYFFKDAFTINSDGNISGTSDNFVYNYMTKKVNEANELTSHVQKNSISSRVYELQQNINQNASTGLMIRQSLDAASKNVFIANTSQGIVFSYRQEDSSETQRIQISNKIVGQVRLKLEREGNLYRAYYSTSRSYTKANWIFAAEISINITGDFTIGLATASFRDDELVSAIVDQIKIDDLEANTMSCSPEEVILESNHQNNSLDLSGNNELNSGEYLVSQNKKYKLSLLNNGDLVLYASSDVCNSRKLWQPEPLFLQSEENKLILQDDGNLVLYTIFNYPGFPSIQLVIWSSNTAGSGANRVVLQDDGNLVLYSYNKSEWASNTADEMMYKSVFKVKGESCSSVILSDEGSSKNYLLSEPKGFMKLGDYLISENRKYKFQFQDDGLFLYSTSDDPNCNSELMWKQVKSNPNQELSRFALQSNGNLALFGIDQNSRRFVDMVWSSETSSSTADSLVLENNGNLVLYKGNVKFWTSRTANPSTQMATIPLPEIIETNEENLKINSKIILYPNPSKGVIEVESPQPHGLLLILDKSGKVIETIKVNPSQKITKIDLSHLPKSLYFVSLYSEFGELYETKKVVVK